MDPLGQPSGMRPGQARTGSGGLVFMSGWFALVFVLLCLAAETTDGFILVGAGLPHVGRRTHLGAIASLRATLPGITYGELQHCGVLVDDVKTAVDFYVEVLGMKDVSELRPAKLEYPGAFLACGKDQIHLMMLPSMDPREGRPEHGGRDRHLAVTINNIDPLAESLQANGVAFTMSKSGRRALFCRDPYMNAIEFVEDTSIN